MQEKHQKKKKYLLKFSSQGNVILFRYIPRSSQGSWVVSYIRNYFSGSMASWNVLNFASVVRETSSLYTIQCLGPLLPGLLRKSLTPTLPYVHHSWLHHPSEYVTIHKLFPSGYKDFLECPWPFLKWKSDLYRYP